MGFSWLKNGTYATSTFLLPSVLQVYQNCWTYNFTAVQECSARRMLAPLTLQTADLQREFWMGLFDQKIGLIIHKHLR